MRATLKKIIKQSLTFAFTLMLLSSASTSFAKESAKKPIKVPVKQSKRIIPPNIQAGLNQLIKKYSNLNMGIIVQSVKTKAILYQHNANHLYTPASVLKLFTATAAAAYLKPDFKFATQLLSRAEVTNGTLNGDLTIKFSGDPELTSKQLNHLIGKLHKLGIHKITGNIYIDRHDYNNVPYPPGWLWDDLSYSYAAPMSAIIINQNKFNLSFTPAKEPEKAPHISSSLPSGIAHFANYVTTVTRYRQHCPLAIYSNNRNDYVLRGCLNKRLGKQHRILAIRNIAAYAKAIVKKSLNKHHIHYTGSIFIHRAEPHSRVLATHWSRPLNKIIYEMLKDSNNLTTNSLLKKLGERYYRSQGTWQNGLRALKQILSKPTGINFKKNLITDGAGLSRYNLISPRQISKLLYYIEHNSHVRPVIFNALPIAGKDGTLGGRMIGQGKSERIHAKTGSMTGVTALAGYVISKHNGLVSFVIMINGFIRPRRPYVQLENRICKLLVNAKKTHHG